MSGLSDADWTRMRRAGVVLVVVGLADIAACAVSMVRGSSYSSSLNIFAVIAGVLVYKGNLGAVRFATKGLSFLLGVALVLPLVVPVIVPWRLLVLQIRLWPRDAVLTGLLTLALLGVLYWLRRTLASLRVYPGRRPALVLYRSPAAAVGAALPLLLAVVLSLVTGGAAGQRAVAEARRQVGPEFDFYVQQLSFEGDRGSGVVLAYSDTEIRPIVVEWFDQ